MISAYDRYIYLTRNHYVNSGQAAKDITYMNDIYKQNQIKKFKDNSKQYTNAIHNLFDSINNITNVNNKVSKKTNINSIEQANSMINEIEDNSRIIIEACGEGRYIDQAANQLRKQLTALNMNNIDEQLPIIKNQLQNISSNLKRKFIRNNPIINKAIDEFVKTSNGLYNKSNKNIINTLESIKVAATQELSNLMATLHSCYFVIAKNYATQKGVKVIREDVQKMLKSIGLKDYKPAKLQDPVLQLKSSSFKPKIQNNKNTTTLTYSNLKLKINRIVKPIIKNFDKIVGKEFFVLDLKDDLFLYHFANLAQSQIRGEKGNYNQQLSPFGLDISRQAAQILGVRRYINENKLGNYYYINNQVKSVNEIYKNSQLRLRQAKPWSAAITTNDKRYFSNKSITPQRRIADILSDLHKEKIRIAIK